MKTDLLEKKEIIDVIEQERQATISQLKENHNHKEQTQEKRIIQLETDVAFYKTELEKLQYKNQELEKSRP